MMLQDPKNNNNDANRGEKRKSAHESDAHEESSAHETGEMLNAENKILIDAICHKVFPDTARRLRNGGKYRNMVSLFSESNIDRAKRTLYLDKENTKFDLMNWLNGLKVDIGLKIEFLQILARALGDDWSEDSRNFLDITIAMSRLQVMLRRLCQNEISIMGPERRGSAIIAVPPGETHQFGQCIVEELFSTRGWTTELFVPANADELVDHIVRADHDIVCLSWSSSELSSVVEQTIDTIESIHANHRPAIIAGGVASIQDDQWLVKMGVDCVCDSAYSALNIAENLLIDARKKHLNFTP